MAEVAPPCLGCGSCCFSELTEYVRVDGDDHARIGDQACQLTVFVGNRCYMKMEGGHCGALVIDIANRRFVCSIYETRPQICRDLERGASACRAEIHEKGERPVAALLRLAMAQQPMTASKP